MLEAFPSQVTDHWCDTAGIAIVTNHESRCSPLDSFNLADVHCGMWVPYCGSVLYLRSHECLVAGVFDCFWACWQIPTHEDCSVVGLLRNGVNVRVLVKVRPKYFALFVRFSCMSWMVYFTSMIPRLFVILMTSHLSGLKCICQSFSHSCRLHSTIVFR